MQSWAHEHVNRRCGTAPTKRAATERSRTKGLGVVRLVLSVVGVALLASGMTAHAAGSIFGSAEPVPDWVKTAAQQKLPLFPGNPKAVVLVFGTRERVAFLFSGQNRSI